MTSKTILQVLPQLETGGVEKGTVEIAAAIVKKGWRAVVVSHGGKMVRALERVGAEHITLPMHKKNPISFLLNIFRLKRIIKAYEIDVVHARSRAPAWSAYFAAKALNIPFVTTFHGTYNFKTNLKRNYNSIMAKGDVVIAISEFIKEHITTHYLKDHESQARIRIIHRGIDEAVYHPDNIKQHRLLRLINQYRLPENKRIILLPARLTALKGHPLLLQALAQIDHEDAVAVFIGSDQGRTHYRTNIERLIKKLGLEGRVYICEECHDMPALYRLASIVVSTSTKPEAFGRTVVEAQAVGKPIIAPRHGAALELIIEHETGFFFEACNETSLSKTLQYVLDMPVETLTKICETAQLRAFNEFSLSSFQEKTIAVYEELLGL